MAYSSYTYRGRTLTKIGVIGSGQIGPDIALYFSKILATEGVPIVVVDVSPDALAKGQAKMEKKIAQGADSGAFKPDHAKAMRDMVTWTSDYSQLSGASLIIEAATEDKNIKHKIVAMLESTVADDCLICSNSSHMEPEVIFEQAKHKARTAVIHYFFPAERNIIVEIVPGKDTASDVSAWLMSFYEAIGKIPIQVGSRYGYAIDPIFEGMFFAAALCVEAGMGTVKQVDTIARDALGLGIGPFTAMNLTGGNPITAHGLDQYTTKINDWFYTPTILKNQLARNAAWEVAARGETVGYLPEQKQRVTDAMTGAYFGIVTEILNSGISNVADLDMAVATSLVVRAPFTWMNEIGVKEALRLVEAYKKLQPKFVVPDVLRQQAESGKPWDIPVVLREVVDGVQVLRIRRPGVLNALDLNVFNQLQQHVASADSDNAIAGTVITGYGVKAFVSGGDIGMLSKLTTPEAAIANSSEAQAALNAVEAAKKPVVAAVNGIAFGGGMELAMACHDRVVASGLRNALGQPEVNLGIIPGAGGTQRLTRLIGVEKAAQVIRTGKPFGTKEAVEYGLAHSESSPETLVDDAIALVKRAAAGEVTLKKCPSGPAANVPASLPAVEIGHLSTAIDAIVSRAILEGAKMSLADGLKHESQMFGECAKTEDMKIGMANFFKNGPRVPARFVNK